MSEFQRKSFLFLITSLKISLSDGSDVNEMAHLIRQLLKVGASSMCASELGRFVPANNVLQCGRDHEVLLFQTEFFALEEVIVRIQHSRDVLSQVTVQHSLDIIAGVEAVQIEVDRRSCRPQSHGVHNVVLETRDRVVVGHGKDNLGVHPLSFPVVVDDPTVEMDWKLAFRSRNLPRVAELQPIVGLFNLLRASDGLSEDSVLIPAIKKYDEFSGP